MTITSTICSMVNTALLSLTPRERFSATGRLSGTNASEHSGEGMLLAAVAVLMLLAILLWWVSNKRKQHDGQTRPELFAESAGRHGLSIRERQILLAVVVRSGLGQSQDIFTAVDAFDQGAAKLLAECGRTRTAEENESLRAEIAYLRSKLGFEVARSQGGSSPAKRPSSRDIPVGKIIELTRRQRDVSSVQAEVIRNDDLELAVELRTPVEIKPGDSWLARYDFGASFWEFDTAAVRCEGTRLVLNHSDQVRFIHRRRFPRASVALPALVAPLPFMTNLPAARPDAAKEDADPDRGRSVLEAPPFVRGVVTEMAGSGLQIEVPMRVSSGDRVLVIFRLDNVAYPVDLRRPTAGSGCVIADVGRIRHVQEADEKVVMAVELVGLSEMDIDRLVRFTNAIQSRGNASPGDSDPGARAGTDQHAVVAGGMR